jgi:RNase H-fold protein (predicted Holliday junction resolvase)
MPLLIWKNMDENHSTQKRRKYLGIDIGKRCIGYAYYNGEIILPLSIKRYDALRTALFLDDVASYINLHQIDTVVVGITPYTYQALYNDYILLHELCKKNKVRFRHMDEKATSSNFRRFTRSKKYRIDDMSAALILERYLDIAE